MKAEEKFRRVGWTEVEKGCWEWKGSRDTSGYGQFHIINSSGSRERVGVHRLALEIKIGRKLSGEGAKQEYALHSCDNRSCVNPDHLRVGTHLDNMKDKVKRGRAPSKLSPEDVKEIFRLRGGGMLQREIAEIFSIHQAYVSEILLKKKRGE